MPHQRGGSQPDESSCLRAGRVVLLHRVPFEECGTSSYKCDRVGVHAIENSRTMTSAQVLEPLWRDSNE